MPILLLLQQARRLIIFKIETENQKEIKVKYFLVLEKHNWVRNDIKSAAGLITSNKKFPFLFRSCN